MNYYDRHITEAMVGATIFGVNTGTDIIGRIRQANILTDKGIFIGEAVGDCCAVAWIDEIATGTAIGGTITGINTIDKESVEGDFDNVRDSFTEIISTTQGDMALFTFCEHNGYYGGCIEWDKA
jgi:hypothetical protein